MFTLKMFNTLSFFLDGKNNNTCADNEFQCKNALRKLKKCIPYDKVCDKQEDCPDGSDEPLHCNVNEHVSVPDMPNIVVSTKELEKLLRGIHTRLVQKLCYWQKTTCWSE